METFTKYIKIDELKVGQKIHISFFPDSQKYLDLLTPKTGIITTIDKFRKDYNIIIKNEDGKLEPLLHEGVSYMGHSLGYFYTITLVE
jgi:hypothetical protein